MNKLCVAFDTSNYTTSAARFDGETGFNSGRLLDVPEGQLGLRQSDAVFAHVKRLPEVFSALGINQREIAALGVSDRPREEEGSYMPCFLAGLSQAQTIAELLCVPLFRFSHQQGHLAAAAWSSKREDLLDAPFLAWHLSGGTTELLYVRPSGRSVTCERVGGTTDLSAGQLADRTGVMLGLGFPAGKKLDELSKRAAVKDYFKVKINGAEFSLSGLQNKTERRFAETNNPEGTAYYALRSVVYAVEQATYAAKERFGDLPLLFSGGVASNSLLREHIEGIYGVREYCTDNALGTAVLTYRQVSG
jgi:N6-L-threonylcarbamoyladenine synthase